jgi:hypothetical protein
MREPEGEQRMGSQEDIASYVATHCLDLKKLAQTAKLPMLIYLLDMAALEAANTEAKLHQQRTRAA